jgi:uncharacterized protein YndB with AHSA1/START domain
MLTTILIVAAIAVAAVLVFAAMKPDTFRISRTATFRAQAERIYPLVNDLRAHRSWSPFDQDPATKRSYTGETVGKGAALDFDGGRATGVGRLAILEADPPSKVMLSLKMSKPFKCDNIVEFTFEPAHDGAGATTVTWAMHGPQPFFGKVMNTFIDCDKMVGRQFEQGLAKLKALAEA